MNRGYLSCSNFLSLVKASFSINKMDKTKKCEECGRELFGRVDKKFCTDACRSAYNNRLTGGHDRLVRSVNRKLRKNRTLLMEVAPEGKAKVKKEKLFQRGFHFDLFTSTYKTKDDRVYHFCYEYGYLDLGNDYLLVVKRDQD